MDAQAVYRRDRNIILASLAGVTLLAWLYMYAMAAPFGAVTAEFLCAPRSGSWGPGDILTSLAMWNIMMVGMMIPTASPMILMFATTNRRQRGQSGPYVPTFFFVSGYVLIWAVYSIAGTAAQWGLQEAALLSPLVLQVTPQLGAVLLIVAGLFQFTSLKHNCLTHCRTPMAFLNSEWREGAGGAMWMGLKHGSYCVGCCWAIMLLMFVAGLMNLVWTAFLAAFMLLEKIAPAGDKLGRIAGVLAVGAGMWLLSGIG